VEKRLLNGCKSSSSRLIKNDIVLCADGELAVPANQLHSREARRDSPVEPHTAAVENLEVPPRPQDLPGIMAEKPAGDFPPA